MSDGPDLVGIRGALTLLLSEVSTSDKAAILQDACPDLVVHTPLTGYVTQPLGLAYEHLKHAAGIVDGSSGLGALAAKNANGHIVAVRSNLKIAMQRLGIKTND